MSCCICVLRKDILLRLVLLLLPPILDDEEMVGLVDEGSKGLNPSQSLAAFVQSSSSDENGDESESTGLTLPWRLSDVRKTKARLSDANRKATVVHNLSKRFIFPVGSFGRIDEEPFLVVAPSTGLIVCFVMLMK